MRLVHYNKNGVWEQRFNGEKDFPQPHPDHDGFKPKGLWVSVEGPHDWRWWCEAEQFRVDNLAHAFEIVLKPEARILMIDSLPAIDAFHRKHAVRPPRIPSMAVIDWQEVARHWDGIIIAPYQWERRLAIEFMWYYGWDCASGCIWSMSAVQSVKKYEEDLLARPAEINA